MAKNNKNKPLFGGFDRLQSFPLDSSSVFDTWEELQQYTTSPIAYHGQIVVCLDKSNDEEHFGAYIMQNKTGTGGTTYHWPYKLAGSNEFAAQVGKLRDALEEVDARLSTLTTTTVADLQTNVTKINNWLDSVTDSNGDSIFATKTRVEELANLLNAEIQRVFGDEIDKIEAIIEKTDTINEISMWIDTYWPIIDTLRYDFRSNIDQHSRDIEANRVRIYSLANELVLAEAKIDNIRETIRQLEDHERRIRENKAEILSIKETLNSVERFAQYDFTSLPLIGGPVFTPAHTIKRIEIVLDNIGNTGSGNVLLDSTSLTVELVDKTNPQSVNPQIVIAPEEIAIVANTRMIYDLDFVPASSGYLLFKAENSHGLVGHAYVVYAEVNEYEPEEEVPAGNDLVYVEAETVTLSEHELTLEYNSSHTLSATVTPASSHPDRIVYWTTLDKDIISVSPAGVVSAIGLGTATVRATCDNVYDECHIVSKITPTSLILNEAEVSGEREDTFQIIATVVPLNATNDRVTYTSDNPTVASVSSTGLVTMHDIGVALITVSTVDRNITKQCRVTVNRTVKEVKYEFTSKFWLAKPLVEDSEEDNADWECIKEGLEMDTDRNRGVRLDSTCSGAGARLTVPYTNITKISVECAKTSGGSSASQIGTLAVSVGGTTVLSLAHTDFPTNNINTVESEYLDLLEGEVAFTANPQRASMFIKSITITYEE